VKVVGDSEIYNFPIHHFVHFSSIFERKTCLKSPRLKQIRASHAAPRRRVPARCRARAPRPGTGRLGVRASRGPHATRGHAPSPGRPVPRGASESSQWHASATIRVVPRPGVRRTVRRSVPCRARFPSYHGGIFVVTPSSSASRAPI
jgi:hypothetical protein